MQYHKKNKIASNPLLKMLFATDTMFSMVDVKRCSKKLFSRQQLLRHTWKNYLIANESYKISDMSLMLNKLPPLNEDRLSLYNSSLARKVGHCIYWCKETLNHCV